MTSKARTTTGSLDRRLTYQEPTDGTPDALLDTPATTWPDVATVWAEIRTPTGTELLNAGQLVAVVSHSITARRARAWFPKPAGRFVYISPVYNATPRVFNVLSAYDPDEGNTWVTCLCAEQTTPTA